ncbi:MAG: hypothetical protein PSV36_01360 [Algoriphagus sp.]|nr:hypothetical protein [Algoriphagus sp.]
MKKVKFVSFGKHVFMFSILSFFLAACSMDGSDEGADLKNSKLNDSSLSKNLSLLSENKAFLDALANQAKNSKGTVDPGIDPFARSNKKWVAMASGGGQDLYPGSENPDFLITFNAKEDSEGNDVGMVNWSDTEGNVIASGEVDCLYVEGNRAWVRYGVELNEELWLIWIGFEDNGEGANAEVDRHTYIYGGPASIYGSITCEDFGASDGFGNGFPVEWIRGNVQVQ